MDSGDISSGTAGSYAAAATKVQESKEMSSTATGTGTPNGLTVSYIAHSFVRAYYNALATATDTLFNFYDDSASIVRIEHKEDEPEDGDEVVDSKGDSAGKSSGKGRSDSGADEDRAAWSSSDAVTGQLGIHEVSKQIGECKVKVDTVDYVPSPDNGVLILVTGIIQLLNQPSKVLKSFAQTFLLVSVSEASYAIRSDILRLLPYNQNQQQLSQPQQQQAAAANRLDASTSTENLTTAAGAGKVSKILEPSADAVNALKSPRSQAQSQITLIAAVDEPLAEKASIDAVTAKVAPSQPRQPDTASTPAPTLTTTATAKDSAAEAKGTEVDKTTSISEPAPPTKPDVESKREELKEAHGGDLPSIIAEKKEPPTTAVQVPVAQQQQAAQQQQQQDAAKKQATTQPSAAKPTKPQSWAALLSKDTKTPAPATTTTATTASPAPTTSPPPTTTPSTSATVASPKPTPTPTPASAPSTNAPSAIAASTTPPSGEEAPPSPAPAPATTTTPAAAPTESVTTGATASEGKAASGTGTTPGTTPAASPTAAGGAARPGFRPGGPQYQRRDSRVDRVDDMKVAQSRFEKGYRPTGFFGKPTPDQVAASVVVNNVPDEITHGQVREAVENELHFQVRNIHQPQNKKFIVVYLFSIDEADRALRMGHIRVAGKTLPLVKNQYKPSLSSEYRAPFSRSREFEGRDRDRGTAASTSKKSTVEDDDGFVTQGGRKPAVNAPLRGGLTFGNRGRGRGKPQLNGTAQHDT